LSTGDPVGGVTDDLRNNPIAVLDYIIGQGRMFQSDDSSIEKKSAEGTSGIIYVLLDYFRWMNPQPDVERRLKTVADINGILSTVITGPFYKATEVLENLIPVLDFPLANRKEIKNSLYDVVTGAEKKISDLRKETKPLETELINAVSGLTLREAETAFSKSIVEHTGWDIQSILEEKKQIIDKSPILEFFNKCVSLTDVGGLKNLVDWINIRQHCFSEEAEEYGLVKPRGLLTIGMPGCGKSLICKAISRTWNMPLLRLDFGRLFSSLVGSSERNARDAIKLAEAIAPSILWIDEIEKAISGIQSSSQSDGGTTSRVLSTFLTWMQEKESPVFVVATANNHQTIPPEFLRAGRFDEIFFVDLPNEEERAEIASVLLRKKGLKVKNFNLGELSLASERYSGAEIEKGIDNAMLVGFVEDRRAIKTKDILTALRGFKPLAKMREEDFEELREWAKQRCLPASVSPSSNVNYVDKPRRELDLN
jgi:SpoVK/Ycf46/Vps4 family AAA+-type ATPase